MLNPIRTSENNQQQLMYWLERLGLRSNSKSDEKSYITTVCTGALIIRRSRWNRPL